MGRLRMVRRLEAGEQLRAVAAALDLSTTSVRRWWQRYVGQVPLDSVVVFTTGRAYPVGTLAGGASRRLRIGANGESHIEIEHGARSRRSLRVGTYSESGYGGKIDVRLTPDSIVAIADSITI